MEKMRELIQRSTSGSTELAASADQMSKMSRTLLDSMDRFVLESTNGHRNGHVNGSVNGGKDYSGSSRYSASIN